jgi:hypothetical protein
VSVSPLYYFDDSRNVSLRLTVHPEGLPPFEERVLFVEAEELSVHEQDHVVGDAPHLLHDVGCEDDRSPVARVHEARDVVQDLPAGEGVHAGGRLVEDEEFGAAR